MQLLTCDVVRHILTRYALAYRPVWCMVCKPWQAHNNNINTVVDRLEHVVAPHQSQQTTSYMTLLDLAHTNRTDTLIWIWRSRTLPWSRDTANKMMHVAAKRGYISLLTTCRNVFQASDVNGAMCGAAKKGHEPIVRLCHEMDSSSKIDVHMVMCAAARGGHINIVRLCHDEWGCKYLNLPRMAADAHGHDDIVELLDRWGAKPIDCAM